AAEPCRDLACWMSGCRGSSRFSRQAASSVKRAALGRKSARNHKNRADQLFIATGRTTIRVEMTKLSEMPVVAATFDPLAVRREFPILQTRMNGKPLVYLDNAATTQKPRAVIDAITHYYTHDNANIHRGVYALSQRATDAYEAARK